MSKTNNATAAEEETGPETGHVERTPEGFELKGNLSFRRLNPDAGITAVRSGQPVLCGMIAGMAYAYVHGESQFGQFTRLIGEFVAVPADRSRPEITATELFLPGVAERFVCAALDKGARAVPIRFEGWAYPDDSGRPGSEAKYIYRVFVRQPPGQISVARRMAIECGMIEAPTTSIAGALEFDGSEGEPFDLETGEIAEGLSKIVKGERTAPEAAPAE